MRTAVYRDIEGEILEKTFDYLVRNGLESVTIRELCKDTGISLGSIYYWFEGKNELVLDATEHGLKNVADKIFSYAFKSIDNLESFFISCLDEVSKYKLQLRFIYQIATSPQYGDELREKADKLTSVYDRYADKLTEKTGFTFEEIRPLVYLFIATVLDYIVWDDFPKAEMQLKYIYNALQMKTAEAAV